MLSFDCVFNALQIVLISRRAYDELSLPIPFLILKSFSVKFYFLYDVVTLQLALFNSNFFFLDIPHT